LSAQVKSADTEHHLEVTDTSLKEKINTLAINAFLALGAKDYGRIDVRLDSHGTPHFLEANLLPSLVNGYGNFPKSCLLNNDLEYGPMILTIASLAFMRSGAEDTQADEVSPRPNTVLSLVSPEPVFKPA
jgi:D-alanine-D-alanine ligase